MTEPSQQSAAAGQTTVHPSGSGQSAWIARGIAIKRDLRRLQADIESASKDSPSYGADLVPSDGNAAGVASLRGTSRAHRSEALQKLAYVPEILLEDCDDLHISGSNFQCSYGTEPSKYLRNELECMSELLSGPTTDLATEIADPIISLANRALDSIVEVAAWRENQRVRTDATRQQKETWASAHRRLCLAKAKSAQTTSLNTDDLREVEKAEVDLSNHWASLVEPLVWKRPEGDAQSYWKSFTAQIATGAE